MRAKKNGFPHKRTIVFFNILTKHFVIHIEMEYHNFGNINKTILEKSDLLTK